MESSINKSIPKYKNVSNPDDGRGLFFFFLNL